MMNSMIVKSGSLMGVRLCALPAMAQAHRGMSMERVAQEMREDEELKALRQEYLASRFGGPVRTGALPLHHNIRLREGRAFASHRRARQPNLGFFAVASVTAGLATYLLLENQDASKPKDAGMGPRLPELFYREAELPAPPNPLRVKLEANMAQQSALRAELATSQLSNRRRREISRELNRLGKEQAEVLEAAKRVLLQN